MNLRIESAWDLQLMSLDVIHVLHHDVKQVNQTPSSREDNTSLLGQLWGLVIIIYAATTSPWTVIMATQTNKLITVTTLLTS